jgi:hypothetical protein
MRRVIFPYRRKKYGIYVLIAYYVLKQQGKVMIGKEGVINRIASGQDGGP